MTATGPTPERRVALAVLARVRGGAYADRALAGEVRRADLSPAQRAQAHRLAFGAVQRRRTLDWLIDAHVHQPQRLEPDIRDVLRLAAYELGWSDAVPAPVTVDQAVRLAGAIPGAPSRKSARRGVVNAVTRALSADVAERLASLADDDWQSAALRHSVPDWIARELWADLGAHDAATALAAANEPQESIVRWNALRGPWQAFVDALPPESVRCDPPFDDAVRIPGAFALEDSALWEGGLGMAQSRASMLPVLALDPQPGERVLDLCSAPGAKTSYLAARMGGSGSLTAVELHESRASGLAALAARMGAAIEVVAGDALTVTLDGGFDAVLLDPPCSGLGVLATRPDARWRRREEHVPVLAALQRELLERALALTRPGGRVVYSTCTLLRAENEDVVCATGAQVDDLTGVAPTFANAAMAGTLRTLPGRDGTDGFFVARLRPAATG